MYKFSVFTMRVDRCCRTTHGTINGNTEKSRGVNYENRPNASRICDVWPRVAFSKFSKLQERLRILTLLIVCCWHLYVAF